MTRVVLIYFLIAVGGILFESSAVHGLFPTAVAPDLLVLLVVYSALHFRSIPGLVGAFSIGLLGDFASAQLVGPCAGAMTVAYCVVSILSRSLYAERGLALLGVSLIGSLTKSLVIVGFNAMFVGIEPTFIEVIKIVLWEAVFTAALSPLVFRLIRLSVEGKASRGGVKRLR